MQETGRNLGSNLDWFSLSLKPVQKLPQLKMLLERLLKKTPKDHPDRFAKRNCRNNHMNLVQIGSAGEHTGFGEASCGDQRGSERAGEGGEGKGGAFEQAC